VGVAMRFSDIRPKSDVSSLKNVITMHLHHFSWAYMQSFCIYAQKRPNTTTALKKIPIALKGAMGRIIT